MTFHRSGEMRKDILYEVLRIFFKIIAIPHCMCLPWYFKIVCFEVGYCYIFQAGLKLTILLPQCYGFGVKNEWMTPIGSLASHLLVLFWWAMWSFWGLRSGCRQGTLERDLKVTSTSSSHLRPLLSHRLRREQAMPQAQPQLPCWTD